MSSQLYLDPEKAIPQGEWVPPGPIPSKVRSFGFYPNVDDWQPGDLILVSNTKPKLSHRVIEQVQQQGGYAHEDARWHHAAVYLGDGEICEADLPGIGWRPLYRYVTGEHLIRVRRDLFISDRDRWRIALRSLTRLRQRYGYEHLVDIGFLSLSGFWMRPNRLGRLPGQARICSQLYMDAYSTVTMKVLQNPISGEITPAFLSYTKQLSDVDVYWLQIQ